MHDNDDKPRVLRLVGQDGAADDEYPELWSYDDGREAGYRVGYRQGRADATVQHDIEAAAEAARVRLWVTWGLVAAFTLGGVFGVGMCRVVWPLVDAGVLP